MDEEKRIRLKNISSIIRLILTIALLGLTAYFISPISQFISKSTSSALSENLLIAEYLSLTEGASENSMTEEEASDEPTTENEEASDEKKNYAYETPQDIKLMEQEYLSAFSSLSAAGTVEEVFFVSSGSTHNVGNVYIKNATATKSPDFAALINEGAKLKISDKSEPVVLIFHTHTTESYLPSATGEFYEDYSTRSTDSSKNMLRIGEEICRVLGNNGIGYIHDTNVYDESYNGAYSRSRVTVNEYLRQYPSIKIVLDVHRDAIYYSDTSRCKPTAEIDGRKAAQIMIITGAEEGYITDFPDWEDNLRFALCFQKTAQEKYEGLMKPIYFCQRKYNMDTAGCSLLLEIGTDVNTLDEALYSAYLTGNILSEIINSYSGE